MTVSGAAAELAAGLVVRGVEVEATGDTLGNVGGDGQVQWRWGDGRVQWRRGWAGAVVGMGGCSGWGWAGAVEVRGEGFSAPSAVATSPNRQRS